MLEIIFGWRKASRCKRLIKRVQCRLKLLKNKRSWIVRQLRDDVAQLLKHGHKQKAFDRVEQIFLDESIFEVYDLLDHFCEFTIINLSYIRKHRDCPNDVREAVSTLIYTSARCGNLPELREIRKLFGERYGQRFLAVALELLPGNLVNPKIQENLSIHSVADDIKWSLVDEIWRTSLQTGLLTIEYYPQLQATQDIQKLEDEVVTSDIQSKYTMPYTEAFDTTEEDGEIVYVKSPSVSREPLYEPRFSSPSSSEPSINSYRDSIVKKSNHPNIPYEYKVKEKKENDTETLSFSASSFQWPDELVYLDDIEEYKSPTSILANSQDQRLFIFKPSVIISNEKSKHDFNQSYIDKSLSLNEKLSSRSMKSKRQKRITLSQESTNVRDFDSAISNGQKNKNSMKYDHLIVPHQWPTYDQDENINQSILFQFEKAKNDLGSCRHVHPKLPDYEKLAATFKALKKANMQIKSK